MKNNLKLIIIAVLLSWTAGSASALEQVDGYYQIGTPQDWTDFCELHNNGNNQNLNAVLTADITVVGNNMVGINGGGKPYRGIFNGQGHKLTISYELNEERVAPFRRINGATIKNLIVEGTITTTSKLAAGVVGGLWQSGTTIQNCISYVTITDGGSGDATHGGICGSFEDVNGANTIENCAFLGSINAPNREGCGGIVGWTNNNNSNNFIRNCLVNAAGYNVKTASNNDIICRNNANVVNCYYIGSIDGMKNDKGAIAATAEQAESGELCYRLNGNTSTDVVWFQTIGTDVMPSPMGTAIVYANGELKCDGITPKEGSSVTFSNVEGSTIDDHTFVDGYCAVCHNLQEVDGFYQIGCADALARFSEIVRTINGGANAVLTKDIDMTDKSWTPIGQDAHDFKGHFNGQGHRIMNLVVNNLGSYDNQALFGQVIGTAIIENVIMDASCSIKGKEHVAGILGHVWGHGAIIRNCVNEASVESSGSQAAGIVATAEKKVIIENCVNKGEIKSNANSAAGILARVWNDSQTSEVNNCTNEGHIIGVGNEIGGIVASLNKAITVDGCLNVALVEGIGVSNKSSYVGGILGRIWANDIIVQNCGNEGRISGTGANAAGIVGCSGNLVKILNCYNLGNITGYNESAAICGWMGDGSSELKNCYSTGTVSGIDGTNYLIRKTDIIKSNNYQLDGLPGDQGTVFYAGDLESGKLAYMLNGSKSTEVTWYQNLGDEADAYPMPWGTKIVYKNGDLYCDGSSKGSDSYSNIEGANRDAHHFNDGFCDNVNGNSVVCEELDASFMEPSDGYYQVSTSRQLRWTAAVSQMVANASIKVKLVNDINMAGEKFDGFGSNESESNRFIGEIDGQRHIISSLSMSTTRDGVGLVNTAANGATVKNLTIASNCSFSGVNAVAALIGAIRGSGDIYILNCGNEGSVTSTGQNAGGVVGVCFNNGGMIAHLTNVYNVGEITGATANESGSLSGWMTNAVLVNCYSIAGYPTSENTHGFQQGNQFARGNGINLTNCYDYGTGLWGQNESTWGEAFENGRKITNPDDETQMGAMFAGLYDAEGGNVWRMEYDGWAHPVLYDPATLVLSENVPNRFVSQNGVDLTLKRTTVADTWNTICLPFALDEDGVKDLFGKSAQVAELTGSEGSTLNFSTVPAIAAGKAYLVMPSEPMTTIDLTGVDLVADAPTPTTEGGYAFTGIYEPTTIVANDLFVAAENKLVPSNDEGKLKAFRAYFHNTTGAESRFTDFVIDNIATGLKTVMPAFTEVQGTVFDLQGRRTVRPVKGLYIVGGKKMVVK